MVAEDFFNLLQSECHNSMDTSRVCGHSTMFVAELSVGSVPVPIWAGVDMDIYGASSDLMWVCWWSQVTEEEVHLCRAAAARHHFLFFYCIGDVGEDGMAVEDSVPRILQC